MTITATSEILEKLRRIPKKNECLPGTRVTILEDLQAWAMDPDASHIFWLNGMAGTGKSTIALSLVRRLLELRLLGGYFLCSRDGSPEERDVRSIIPSLSDFLASLYPDFRAARTQHLALSQPVNLTLDDQFESLLGTSISSAFGAPTAPMMVFIIDALDECEDHEDTQRLVQILMTNVPSLPIKFLITSRPESHISQILSSPYPLVLRLHDVDEAVVQGDILLYLKKKLSDIGHLHNILSSSETSTWPTESQISMLSQNAERFFVYASTAVKYIAGGPDPETRLDRLLTRPMLSTKAMQPIYSVYALVLNDAFQNLETDEAQATRRCLAAIVYERNNMTVLELGCLLRLSSRQIRTALCALHSLIDIPDDESNFISTFHASFSDYLRDDGCHDQVWFTDARSAHLDLAEGCLTVMSSRLCFNIAGALSSSVRNQDQQLADIPMEVAYACFYWQDHITASTQCSRIFLTLRKCLQATFLYWVEVLSVFSMVDFAARKLRKVIAYSDVCSMFFFF